MLPMPHPQVPHQMPAVAVPANSSPKSTGYRIPNEVMPVLDTALVRVRVSVFDKASHIGECPQESHIGEDPCGLRKLRGTS